MMAHQEEVRVKNAVMGSLDSELQFPACLAKRKAVEIREEIGVVREVLPFD